MKEMKPDVKETYIMGGGSMVRYTTEIERRNDRE
jgi:hypothetical protein